MLRTAVLGSLVTFVMMVSTAQAQRSPHGTLSIECGDCHTASSWKEMAFPSRFEHEKTGFALAGQHSLVKCISCHSSLKFAREGSQCVDCHSDVHRGELGTLCERCHSSQSWVIPDMIQKHAQTRFSLVGAHAAVNCDRCHTNLHKYEYVGLRSDCYACHAGTFEITSSPNHRSVGFSTDCVQCHSVMALQWGTTFDHALTGFPLTGAHRAIPCAQCHPGGTFTNARSQCVGCHLTDFNNTTNPPHSSGFSTECQTCHSTAAWQPATFNHDASFPLTGAHRAIPCARCHPGGTYTNAPTQCVGCHLADFTGATNPPHSSGFSTECQTCHSTTAWEPANFNHAAAFPLTGAHSTVPCANCHPGNNYANTPRECSGCHLDDYNTATNPVHSPALATTCQTCHSTTAWRPSTFNHESEFPIAAGTRHSPGRWNACSDCHIVAGNYSAFSCTNCHAHDNKTQVDSGHRGESGYTYTPTSCYTCHPRGNA